MNVIGIILAAGSSSRMTNAKQLLQYKGQSLIRTIADLSLQLSLNQTYCVTGSLTTSIHNELDLLDIEYIHNPYYKEGMGKSLSVAIEHIISLHDPDAVLVMLSDQPLIPLSHYQNILKKAAHNQSTIITTQYNDSYGAPTLFTKTVFSDLLSLSATSGAKSIIAKHIDETAFIKCKAAGFDVDTDEDYERLVGVR